MPSTRSGRSLYTARDASHIVQMSKENAMAFGLETEDGPTILVMFREADHEKEEMLATMLLRGHLIQLMTIVPPAPTEDNLALIGRRYRGLDYVVMFLIVIVVFILVSQYFVGLYRSSVSLLLVPVYFYMFSKKVDMWWGEYYMSRAQADFDANESRAWVVKPPESRSMENP